MRVTLSIYNRKGEAGPSPCGEEGEKRNVN
jgi:hypothetical protein